MEVRIESMICLWDDKIPTMFLEFMNLLTLCHTISTCINATRATPKW